MKRYFSLWLDIPPSAKRTAALFGQTLPNAFKQFPASIYSNGRLFEQPACLNNNATISKSENSEFFNQKDLGRYAERGMFDLAFSCNSGSFSAILFLACGRFKPAGISTGGIDDIRHYR